MRRGGRVEATPATLELFARSLAADDQVVLEATGNALAIVRIIEPHVVRVVLANPKVDRRRHLVVVNARRGRGTRARAI